MNRVLGSGVSSVTDAAAVIEWIDVVKRYPKATSNALDQVSFQVGSGEIVVLVGPNGSGKTTAMEMASGLRVPSQGRVRVLGREVQPSGPHRMTLGVQLQESGLPARLRVREAFRAVQCLYANPGSVDEIIKQMGLDDYLDSAIESLSGGWQRRLDVALACVGNPRALVLDEPTSGIDPVARTQMWEFLRRRRAEGTGVLVSTHDLSEAEAYADRLLVLNRGKLVLEGDVSEVLKLAGGQWRLRLLGVEPGFDSWAKTNGLDFIVSADSRIHIGDRDEVVRVNDMVDAAQNAGLISCLDAVRGPIRLEDVFAYAVESRTDLGGKDS